MAQTRSLGGSVSVVARRHDFNANLVITGSGAWTVTTPKLAFAAKGAGDALAALFIGRYLDCGDVAQALAGEVSSVFGVIKATAACGPGSCRLWRPRTRSPSRSADSTLTGFPILLGDARHSVVVGKAIGSLPVRTPFRQLR